MHRRERVHRRPATQGIAYTRITAPRHQQIPVPRLPALTTVQQHGGAPPIVQAQRLQRDRTGQQLLVRCRHEQLVGVVAQNRVATLGVHDQQPPARIPPHRRRQHGIDDALQDALRGRRRDDCGGHHDRGGRLRLRRFDRRTRTAGTSRRQRGTERERPQRHDTS